MAAVFLKLPSQQSEHPVFELHLLQLMQRNAHDQIFFCLLPLFVRIHPLYVVVLYAMLHKMNPTTAPERVTL